MTLATSQVWAQKNQKIVKQQVSNEDFSVNFFTGAPPIFMTVASISPEYFSHLGWLLQQSYNLTGISMLTAASQKPAGLNSGKAIDSYNDLQSARFLHVSQEYERFHQRIGRRLFQCAKQIQEETGRYEVRGKSRQGFEYINLKDVVSDEGENAIQVYPTSFFMNTPSGRWKQIENMMSSGFLDKDEGAALLDYPDLDAVTSLRNAPFEYLKMVVDDLLDEGENASIKLPDPGSNLTLAQRWLPLVILRAEQDGAPPENIELVRQYYGAVKEMLAPPPPMEAANGIPGSTPGSVPGTPGLPSPGGTGLLPAGIGGPGIQAAA